MNLSEITIFLYNRNGRHENNDETLLSAFVPIHRDKYRMGCPLRGLYWEVWPAQPDPVEELQEVLVLCQGQQVGT